MNRKGNIRPGLYNMLPPGLLMLLRHVTKKLTGNVHYPDPPMALADMGKLADDLEVSIQGAMQGGLAEREHRNSLVDRTRSILTRTANYVRSEADGDRTMLSTSGFDMAKTPETVGVPLPPIMKAGVATGRTGEVELRWSKERGVHIATLHRCTDDPTKGGVWEEVTTTTRSRHMVTDLVPYQAVWFAVTVTGAAGESAMSEPILVRPA